MFKLRFGYLASGAAIGLILIVNLLWSLPDGNLHIIFCNVGQGDAAYVRFADGRDMLVDGGPNDAVLGCLSRHMPFWDRTIDLVLMSHPNRDHIAGFLSVLSRYRVGYFVRADIDEQSETYASLKSLIAQKRIPVKIGSAGQTIAVGRAVLSIVSPEGSPDAAGFRNESGLVFVLRYGSFDALFTGDTPLRPDFVGAPDVIDVVKVPHHGSKTGFIAAVVAAMRPKTAVISVGKNSFGQPAPDVLGAYTAAGSSVRRTDKEGDIEVISDGNNFGVLTK